MARIREPLLPGGFHNIFIYKHSDGRALLFTTVNGPSAHIYDLARVVGGASAEDALVGRVPDGRYVIAETEYEFAPLQIFNLQDPADPVAVGYYDTYIGPRVTLNPDGVMGDYATSLFNGAFGVDVRNEDGLILISDFSTGLWTFRMDGFQGWNGEQWGVPDISSEQKWDEPVRRPIS